MSSRVLVINMALIHIEISRHFNCITFLFNKTTPRVLFGFLLCLDLRIYVSGTKIIMGFRGVAVIKNATILPFTCSYKDQRIVSARVKKQVDYSERLTSWIFSRVDDKNASPR